MKTKHYFFLSCAVLGLAWGWVYSVSGQTSRPSTLNVDTSSRELPASSGIVKQSPSENASGDAGIYAVMTFSETWDTPEEFCGVYSISASDEEYHELINLTEGRNAGGGAVYVEGILYTISYVKEYYDEDDYKITDIILTAYDTDSWDVLYERNNLPSTSSANDFTYDSTTGNVYGCFNMPGYVTAWGTLDVETGESTIIKDKMTSMSAIATDANGQIYGITTDGKLVTIDKETGENSAPLADYSMYQGWQSTGVIDPTTGNFYWLLNSYGGNAGIYKIDLNSYELTKLCSSENMERFTGAYIPSSTVEPGTPDVPLNVTLFFNEGSLTGNLSFEAPTTSWDDDDLTGTSFTYYVKADGNMVAEGSVNAGLTATTADFTLPQGYNKITVTLTNAWGEGLPATVTAWIGNDGPSNVTDINVVTEGQNINISWNAPTEGMHKGYFNPAEVTYIIKRFPGDVVVASDLADNTYTDNIESTKLTKYHYTITPFYNGIEGKAANSIKVLAGDAMELPWDCTFSDDDCELMTTEDTNADGVTWDIDDSGAYYRFGENGADDWLFTVPFNLETGKNYHLATSIGNGYGNPINYFEIKFGHTANSASMNQSIADLTEFTSNDYAVDTYFSVAETGTYYIGIHALNPDKYSILSVEQILVELGPNDKAPGKPAISAKAGDKGSLEATLFLTAPSLTFDGNTLTQLCGANIFLGDKPIGSVESIKPGDTVEYIDKNCIAGNNTYSVVFVNEEGNGLSAETTVFVGEDMPLAPSNVKVEIKDDVPVLTWDAPGEVGANGGFVNPETLRYAVSYTDSGEWISFEDKFEGTSLEIGYDLSGEQRWFVCGVIAYNNYGQTDAVYSNGLLAGDPYQLPFKENMDNGRNQYIWTSFNPFGSTDGAWTSNGSMSVSDVGGCLLFSPYSFFAEPPFQDTLTSGLIDLTGKDAVVLSFFYYNDAELNAGDELSVALYDQYNDISYQLGEITMDSEETGWRKFEATFIPEAGKEILTIHIGVTSNSGNRIHLDEIAMAQTSGMESVANHDISVYTSAGSITINGAEGENVTVAAANGNLLFNAPSYGETTVPASSGIYVVSIGKRSFKVIVK